MQKFFQTILFLFLIINFFAACQSSSSCPEVKSKSYDLTVNEKSGFPFLGNDSIFFITKYSFNSRLGGHGTVNSYLSQTVKGAAPAECPQLTLTSEYVNCTYFSSDTFLRKIDFILSRVASPSYISKGVWTITTDHPITFTRSFADLINDSIYFDTVYVKGVKYNCIKIQADTGDVTNAVYFNHNSGILRITLPNSQVWYRQ